MNKAAGASRAESILADESNLSDTPYRLTLSGMIFPVAAHWVFDALAGLCLLLVGAPLLAVAWTLCSCVSDAMLQRIYRRWLPRSSEVDPTAGLRRLAALVALRSVLWMSAPVAFTLATHSSAGVANTAMTALGLVALSVSVGWTSRAVFTAMAAPAALGLTLEALALLAPAPAAGLLLGSVVFAATMAMIAIGTHKAVTQWSESHARMLSAMEELKASLSRSEAAERRLRIAIGIADLYVYEVDYVRGDLTSQGDGSAFFERPQTYQGLLENPLAEVHPDDRALVAQAMERYEMHGTPYRTEHRFDWSDGREVWASSVGEVSLDEQGRPLTVVGALQNITEHKKTERDLIDARDAAEAASRAKSEFLATMSHEIRTPLNGVLGMVQAMERDELSPRQRGRLDVIQRSGETLLTILNAVLDIAKIEAGKFDLEFGEVDIGQIARGALDAFTAIASEKDISLALHIEPSAEGLYAGDPTRVGQILYNLISNAVKFTDQGSVSVGIERRDDVLVLKVSDTGIGIDPQDTSMLFEKFRQADASVTRRYGGTGLGLTIASELAGRMGGAIDVDSERGRGSTFTVTLVLARLSDAAAHRPSLRPEIAEPRHALPALRILAAEDNAINQLVLKTLLQQVGVDPTVVGDGLKALAAWEAEEWDLILMDVQMPNLDGPAAARVIRERERESGRRATPIIALTANVMDHQAASYRAAGMNEVVAKPIEAALLFQAIESSLEAAEELTSPS